MLYNIITIDNYNNNWVIQGYTFTVYFNEIPLKDVCIHLLESREFFFRVSGVQIVNMSQRKKARAVTAAGYILEKMSYLNAQQYDFVTFEALPRSTKKCV